MRDYVYPQRFLIAKAFLCTLVFIGTMPLLAELLGRVAQALGKGIAAAAVMAHVALDLDES